MKIRNRIDLEYIYNILKHPNMPFAWKNWREPILCLHERWEYRFDYVRRCK